MGVADEGEGAYGANCSSPLISGAGARGVRMRAGSIRKVTGSAGWKMLKRRHGAGHTCVAIRGGDER